MITAARLKELGERATIELQDYEALGGFVCCTCDTSISVEDDVDADEVLLCHACAQRLADDYQVDVPELIIEIAQLRESIAAWCDVATMFRSAADGEDDGGRAVKAIEMFNLAVETYGHSDYGPEGHPINCPCGEHDRDPQETNP